MQKLMRSRGSTSPFPSFIASLSWSKFVSMPCSGHSKTSSIHARLCGNASPPLHPGHNGGLAFPQSLAWIDEVFEWPEQGILTNFDQLSEAMKDGNGDVLPRDLINFCITAQKLQLNYNI